MSDHGATMAAVEHALRSEGIAHAFPFDPDGPPWPTEVEGGAPPIVNAQHMHLPQISCVDDSAVPLAHSDPQVLGSSACAHHRYIA
eukprot:14962983-Alexandrium_andersonii.AAC.1